MNETNNPAPIPVPFSRPYPTDTGRVRGCDTSEQAGDHAAKTSKRIRAAVYSSLLVEGSATCDEIETRLSLSHQSASARVRELAILGLVIDTGERRKTRSGRNAIVWRATE